MIPEVRISAHATRSRDQELSAFARGPNERRLRIVIDVDSFVDQGQLVELLGFSANRNVETDPIRLSQIKFNDDGNALLNRTTLSRVSRHIIGSARHNIEMIQKLGVLVNIERDPALKGRLALAMYAELNRCDAFVSDSAELLSVARRFYPAGNPMTLSEGFAVLGLHLRLREDFVVKQLSSYREESNGTDFYSSLARCLLGEWNRWNALCPRSKSPFSQSIAGLADAVVNRIARALRARDRMHGFLFREPSPASIDEALFYFDAFLVAVGGAFDAAARVADSAYKIGQRMPGWRRERWRKQLAKLAPALAEAVGRGTPLGATLEVVSRLRNLLHEEPLKVFGVLGSGYKVAEYRAAIPDADRAELLAGVAQLGGVQRWGLGDIQAEFLSLDLGRYVEAGLPAAISGLNVLMRLTEVEKFGIEAEPPFEPDRELAEVTDRLRLLGGV